MDITSNDIIKPKGTCDLKCKYSFKYNDSVSTITNTGIFLKLTYERPNAHPVLFNSFPYYVSNVYIYSPSLHTYSGVKADGEILIEHISDYNIPLWICIPLIKNEAFNKSSNILDYIIGNAFKYMKPDSQPYNLTNTINLNDFIPNKKFYSYRSCDNKNYIVFSKDDGAYCTIKNQTLVNLKSIIKNSTIEVNNDKDREFFVNDKGPQSLSGNVADDIYIDCKPVSDDGNIIESIPTKPKETFLEEMFNPENLKKFKKSVFFYILIGILSLIGLYILFKILMKIIDSFGGNEQIVESSNQVIENIEVDGKNNN
jgi:hypothetical protein